MNINTFKKDYSWWTGFVLDLKFEFSYGKSSISIKPKCLLNMHKMCWLTSSHLHKNAITNNYSQLLKVFHLFFHAKWLLIHLSSIKCAYVNVKLYNGVHPKIFNFTQSHLDGQATMLFLFVFIMMMMTHFNYDLFFSLPRSNANQLDIKKFNL